jgi:hypothetical protein
VKRVLRSAELRDAREILEAAMSFSSVDEIERFVVEQMRTRFPQLVSYPRDVPEPRSAPRDVSNPPKRGAGS